MPMFREDDPGQNDTTPEHPEHVPMPSLQAMDPWLTRRLSEESIRTELCEGPVPDDSPKPTTPQPNVCHVSDRTELIERIKRGESPTWVPNRHLESLLHEDKASSPPSTPQPPSLASPGLLPPATITPDKQERGYAELAIDEAFQEGLTIERPRSALHKGNFTPEESSSGHRPLQDAIRPGVETRKLSSDAIWIATPPQRIRTSFTFETLASNYRKEAFTSPGPSSLSSSLSSSFIYKPPTSPLVQSESNDEIDLTLPLNRFNFDAASPRSSRRHTVNFTQAPFLSTAAHRHTALRRENAHPYQAHQPRRSLNSTPTFSAVGSTPPTPAFLRPRRPSFSSDVSPLQHASMVGSYEESILRGRMSTTPSKPLEFLAQIGVLGLGNCKASLRCPAHVTLPFSAVFYSYASTSYGRSKIEDGPSPYVGQIDLENGLPNPDEGQRARRKLQSRYQDHKRLTDEEASVQGHSADLSEEDAIGKPSRPKRRSRSPKAPLGGRYRIPEKGQLQIIIKNQNKTAVKLFLVPYDLSGMEPGTKTFIRQRSYSAGPVMEPDVPPKTSDNGPGAADRPTLRYLIHLHICCPSKGRYYLYKSIRVVFANRVPDGKERLRNEITYPDPRFSPYKPIRVMHPPLTGIASHATTSSMNIGSSSHAPFSDNPFLIPSSSNTFVSSNQQQRTGIPTGMTGFAPAVPDFSDRDSILGHMAIMPGLEMTGPAISSTIFTNSNNNDNDNTDEKLGGLSNNYYDKLSRGDVGYGGNAFLAATATTAVCGGGDGTPGGATEGLLSQRLRSLGVQQQQQQQQQQASMTSMIDGAEGREDRGGDGG